MRAKEIDNFPILIVGNKADLSNKREVLYNEGIEYSKLRNLDFIETSAKSRYNIDEAFNQLTNIMLNFHKDILNDKKKIEKKDCIIN